MEIINLDSNHLKEAAAVLAASFFNYPMFQFYFPDIKRRTRYLPWYFRNILRTALRYGDAFTTPHIDGVIFALPPGHTKITTWEYIQNGFLLTPVYLGIRNYDRSMECENFVADTHEKLMGNRLHYYLWGLAVDPAQKASGIGAALMRPVLDKADVENVPVYLETHDEKNVSYYQKFGFKLMRSMIIPKYELPFWCMVREI